MEYLDVDVNNIGDEGAILLSTCIQKIEQLHIFGCQLSSNGVQKLAEEILKRETPVNV